MVTTNDVDGGVKANQVAWTIRRTSELASLLTSLGTRSTWRRIWIVSRRFGMDEDLSGQEVTTVLRAIMGELESSIKVGTRPRGRW